MPSGLQREVIHLYRKSLRAIRTKPAHTRPKFLLIIRHTFRSPDATEGPKVLTPRDFDAIEFLLRRARRQLETVWADKNVTDSWVSEEMKEWERGRRWWRKWPVPVTTQHASPPPTPLSVAR